MTQVCPGLNATHQDGRLKCEGCLSEEVDRQAQEIARLTERIQWFEQSGGIGAHTKVFQEMARAEQAELRLKRQQPYLAFWEKVREYLFDGISEADAQEWAIEVGLLVEATYDPAVHGDCEADPGDTIYVDAPWVAAALAEEQL